MPAGTSRPTRGFASQEHTPPGALVSGVGQSLCCQFHLSFLDLNIVQIHMRQTFTEATTRQAMYEACWGPTYVLPKFTC